MKSRIYFNSKILLILFFTQNILMAKAQQTIFEKSNGKETATYFQVIQFYEAIAKKSSIIKIQKVGMTDAGYPLHLILLSADKKFDAKEWHRQKKVVLMVNNGIHPGEPDGMDASMMLVRDIANGKINLPPNVAIGLIAVYNIGGALNRNSFSRVNQDGPKSYGFRGNAQNLDLNRDFTKCDSKNARAFTEAFHLLNPDVLVDTHVSDGADYQYTMTLISSQYDKLGKDLGTWVKNVFDPSLYKGMKEKKWDMVPYVNVEDSDPTKGYSQFYDAPRYSSGYAALFNTIAYMPETHMLKPYKERVLATYDLLNTFIEQCNAYAQAIISKRKEAEKATINQKEFALSWKTDYDSYDTIPFMGYTAEKRISTATGQPVLFYNHNKPFTRNIKYFCNYLPSNLVTAPKAYIVPQGWWGIIDLLKLNNVRLKRLKTDTLMEVAVTHIDNFKSIPTAYEKHHKNNQLVTSERVDKIQFLKGDYVIELNQPAKRYLIEMLDPHGDDSFFSWNFFDAILQEKEGYSDYRWNEVAENFLKANPDIQKKLEAQRNMDSAFAKNGAAQLNFIYKNSPWYEPAHLRYPVYQLK
ncbi:MAG: M14 family metallopeptidase [Bacteroidetes bacterium]|nr:M14 family metallopeptidase [Bacteroidota bacterium]